MYASALISATGTDYGLADSEGLRKSADFVRYMSSNTYKPFGFGSHNENSLDGKYSVLLWLGDYFNSYDISDMRVEGLKKNSFLWLDLLWLDEEKMDISPDNLLNDWGSEGAFNASIRDTWDENGLISVLHTGRTSYFYNYQYDLGSFYLESNGARFFLDLGNEAWYELPNRHNAYRVRSEGHNTLVINPSAEIEQKDGVECVITNFNGGKEAYAFTDLTSAYEPSGAESVVRGMKMIKDKKCVIIQDEISLTSPGEIYWFGHTKADIDIADDGRSAVLTIGSEKMWVGIISEDGKFTEMKAESLPTSPVVPGQSDNSAFKKLAIHLTDVSDTTISVACIPLKQDETSPSWLPTLKAFSEWTSTIVKGDVNGDGKFDVVDLVVFRNWLLGVSTDNDKPINLEVADLFKDDTLNCLDFIMMKSMFFE